MVDISDMIEKEITDLKVNEINYTVPWALTFYNDNTVAIKGFFPCGNRMLTRFMKIQRKRNGIKVLNMDMVRFKGYKYKKMDTWFKNEHDIPVINLTF